MRKFIYGLLILGLAACAETNQEAKTKVTKPETNAKGMNTLGLIGGTSWHSTVEYYSFINQSINDHYENNTNPPLVIYNLNQAEVHRFQKEDKWDSIANMLVNAAINLNKAGASSVLFCANTPHKVYNSVQEKLDFPVIHIADATAKAIHAKGLKKVGFLGTKYSMEQDFITKRIEENGIEVLVPREEKVIEELHRIIQEELTYGHINEQSKKYVLSVINDLIGEGAQGVVLGCTEFPLMIFQEDLDIPVFDTTKIHSMAAVEYILENVQ
ncbi:aspartate/glutamate racemase family protein [Maribacter polysaccharolyticus]|uniref:aspartate/glutamate racemase family protein n=1 Tax=Maribacter polysaccharolyticus TaxID=3020831 RepID=UPI00237F4EB0|nr:amino acid racemase [Maribacter polysaccharolyticus]MDE3741025.1 amino acid racemase [Maribacter polysaccharolyticus]